jgi:hypothetical protein
MVSFANGQSTIDNGLKNHPKVNFLTGPKANQGENKFIYSFENVKF